VDPACHVESLKCFPHFFSKVHCNITVLQPPRILTRPFSEHASLRGGVLN